MSKGAAYVALLGNMKAAVDEAKGIADLAPYADELEKSITALEYLTTELLASSKADDSFLACSWGVAIPGNCGRYRDGVDADLAGGPCLRQSRKQQWRRAVLRIKNSDGEILYPFTSARGLRKILAIRSNDRSLLQMTDALYAQS